VESGEWRLLNNSNIQKYGNLKKSEKNLGLFSIILPKIISDPFSPGWSHQPGLKGAPAFCT
jgi:hypothetical protein